MCTRCGKCILKMVIENIYANVTTELFLLFFSFIFFFSHPSNICLWVCMVCGWVCVYEKSGSIYGFPMETLSFPCTHTHTHSSIQARQFNLFERIRHF